ncbi:uncharacterized protein LOC110875658 [Helianthus annuus]|uniref:uncharacterized protein LOC110875658 n=1 Tax=Helianthus annuus TaxID=4232 RepID=UPI000B8FE6CE|nr:uncharacterized protein LOC110875658 [Helianthus annuus]
MAALIRRNIHGGSEAYRLGREGLEQCEHLFTSCHIAMMVWDFISRWCNIPYIYAFSVKDLIEVSKHIKASKERKKAIQAVVFTATWNIWKARNEAIFMNNLVSISKNKENIKALTFLWIKNNLVPI